MTDEFIQTVVDISTENVSDIIIIVLPDLEKGEELQ